MIISIVVLICIPLVASQLWLVQQSANEIRTNNTNYYIAALQSNSRSYNSQMDMLDYNAMKISADNKVSKPLDSKANGYDLFLAAQVVKSYSIGLPSVEEIGFYYPSRDSVLMNGYSPSKELFFASVGAEDAEVKQHLMQFLGDLQDIDVYFVRNVNTYGRFLVARPVFLESRTEADGVVIYVLDPDELLRTFQVNIPSGSELAIINSEGEWIVYNAGFPVEVRNSLSFTEFLVNDQSYYELTYGRERMDVYKYVDDTTGNIFLASVAQEDSRRELTEYMDRMTAFMAASMVLLVTLFITTVYINYKPVKKLVLRHSQTTGRSDLSELEILDTEFFARDEMISSQHMLLSGFVLGDLIYGTAVDDELLDKQFDRERLRYFVVVTVSAIELKIVQANAVADDLRKSLESAEVHTTSIPNRPHVLFILLSEDPVDPVMLKAAVHLSLRAVTGSDGDVRVGKVVQSMEALRSSYYSSLVEQIDDFGINDISAPVDYPVKETNRFVQYVCIGDKENALKSLEKIEFMLGSRKLRPAYRQYYCYKLLSTFLTNIKDNQIQLPEEDMDALLTFRNPSQLYTLLRETTIKYCDIVASLEKTSNAQLQIQLLEYVNENLTNYELCLLSAAERMNISVYAVSRLFKESTGVGFKEYIIDKRLEMAYRLLKTTRDNVVDVGKKVGFDSASYFSKAFRKKYGISPVQARNGEKEQ